MARRWSLFSVSEELDLTPPISADLANQFRQTVILVSDQPTSVNNGNPRRLAKSNIPSLQFHERSSQEPVDQTPPPIAARPEKTKSIVTSFSLESTPTMNWLSFSTLDRSKMKRARRSRASQKDPDGNNWVTKKSIRNYAWLSHTEIQVENTRIKTKSDKGNERRIVQSSSRVV